MTSIKKGFPAVLSAAGKLVWEEIFQGEEDNYLDLWIGSPDNLSSKLGYLRVKGGNVNNYTATAVTYFNCPGQMGMQGHASKGKAKGEGKQCRVRRAWNVSEGKLLAIFSRVISVDFTEEVMLPHLFQPPFPHAKKKAS